MGAPFRFVTTPSAIVRRTRTWAFGALALLAGCNQVLGIDEPLDTEVPATTGGSYVDVATTTAGTGGARSGSGGAGGSGTAGTGAPAGQGGGSNGAGPDGGGRTVEFAWADWPMPNPSTAGLPYPANYDLTVAAGVVADTITSLKWQQNVDANAFTWGDAHTYCSGLSLAGGGWRLPSRIELLSIVDFTAPNPAIDTRAFPGTPQAKFWSASPVADETASAWAVDFGFGNGLAYAAPTTASNRVRCVR
jgi:hypothetical protein